MRLTWAAVVAAVIVGAGASAGGSWLVRQAHPRDENLHDIIHRRFRLLPAERARLEAAEARYDRRRAQIEADIRAANARLAAAVRSDPELSEQALAASAEVERSAAELQRVTLQHVFEMRAALDPGHRPAYDAVLVDALTRGQ
jgi:hypothetical protein